MKFIIVIGCLLLIFPSKADNHITIEHFFSHYDNSGYTHRDKIHLQFEQIHKGMQWYQATLIRIGSPVLFCPPGKLGFTGSQLVQIIREEVNRMPHLKKKSFIGSPGVLLSGLRNTFPCN